MSRNQLLILAGCILAAIGLFASLFALSPIGNPLPRYSFERRFERAGVYVIEDQEIDLEVNSFYFSGATKNTLYLGNFTGPLYMLTAKLPKLDTQHVILNLKGVKIPESYRAFRLKIDSPYFYLTHGTMPGVFMGHLNQRQGKDFLQVNSPYFMDALPISPTLIALKSMNTDTKASELASLKPDSPYFEFKTGILQKQLDGIFCEEGKLHYDKSTNKLVYLYTYRNEYIVMDTSFRVLARHHTIDTFTRAAINVAKVETKNYSTLASPPVRINIESCLWQKYLFVQSSLLSKNEDDIKFRTVSVIDVYDVAEGTYMYSFYIDRHKGYIPKTFIVTEGHLAAIFDKYLVLFRLNLI